MWISLYEARLPIIWSAVGEIETWIGLRTIQSNKNFFIILSHPWLMDKPNVIDVSQLVSAKQVKCEVY